MDKVDFYNNHRCTKTGENLTVPIITEILQVRAVSFFFAAAYIRRH